MFCGIYICIGELGQFWFRRCLVASSVSSHNLNKCCLRTLRNKLQWNWNYNTKLFINENACENVVCEMVAILSREKWVNKGDYLAPVFMVHIIWLPSSDRSALKISLIEVFILKNASCEYTIQVLRHVVNEWLDWFCVLWRSSYNEACFSNMKSTSVDNKLYAVKNDKCIWQLFDNQWKCIPSNVLFLN